MPQKPQITVVIPAYNAEKTIATALRSVFDQTLRPAEVIVVDDGSTDGTTRVVQTFAPDVTLLRQTNSGPAAARNHGIREAKSEWIALIDADDSWMPRKLEKQAKLLADDVALVHSNVVDSFDQGSPEVTFEELWEGNVIGTSTVVLNKQVFDEVGGFDERRSLIGVEDYNLWLRIAATGKRIRTLQEPLSIYSRTDASLTKNVPKIVEAELFNLEVLKAKLKLSDEMSRAKRIRILEEYSKSLFYIRDLKRARDYYGELLQTRPTMSACVHWTATFLPVSVLNLPRRLASQRAAENSTAKLPSDLVCSQ